MKRLACLLILALCVCGCVNPRAPRSFSQVSAPTWATIEIRDGVEYDHAWKTVLGILVREYDIEFLSKDDGYIRTAWTYMSSGSAQQNYACESRPSFRKTTSRWTSNLKPILQINNVWLLGVDSRQLITLKTDLMGTIGRTTR